MTQLYGGIEAGGTKFVCAVGSGPDDLRDEIRFPTTTPQETIGRAIAYFQQQARAAPLAAIGMRTRSRAPRNCSNPSRNHNLL